MEVKNNAFYELRSRLYASAAAGCSLIAEDFRLKRALEAFQPMSEANKVFGKLYAMCDSLVKSADPAAEIIDCIALADALAVTQGSFADGSETAPVPSNGIAKPCRLTYNELEEYKEKLRKVPYTDVDFDKRFYEVISDPRLLSAFLEISGRNSTGVADLLVQIGSVFGEKFYPLLFNTLDLSDKNATGNQIRYISSVTRDRFNDRYREYAENEAVPEGIRIASIEAMRYSAANEESLFSIYSTSKGKIKSSALLSLAALNSSLIETVMAKTAAKPKISDFDLLCASGSKAAEEFARSELGFCYDNLGKEELSTHPFLTRRFSSFCLLGNKKNVNDVFEKWAARPLQAAQLSGSRHEGYIKINEPLINNLFDYNDPEFRDMIRTLHSRYPEVFATSAFLLALIEEPENACSKICSDHMAHDLSAIHFIRHIFSTRDGWYRIRRAYCTTVEDFMNIKLFRSVPGDMLRFLSDTSVIYSEKELEKKFPDAAERAAAENIMKLRCSCFKHLLIVCCEEDRERIRAAAEEYAWAMSSRYPCEELMNLLPEVTDKPLDGIVYSYVMFIKDKKRHGYLYYYVEDNGIPEEVIVSDLKKVLVSLETESPDGYAELKTTIKRILEKHGIKE